MKRQALRRACGAVVLLSASVVWLVGQNRPAPAGEASPASEPATEIISGPLRFGEQKLTHQYTYAYGLCVADFDGDGHLDLSSSDAEPNSNLYLLKGDGKGKFSFSFIQKYAKEENQPIRLERHAVGDVNGDGRPDIVIVDNLKWSIRWYENPGKEKIASPWKLHRVTADKELPGSYDVALADFDGDGDLDVAASSWSHGRRFDWFENVGSPGDGSKWIRHSIEENVGETRTVAVADFNGDGKPDILGTSRTGNLVVWYENTGKPASGKWIRHVIDSKTLGPMHGHPVDLDGDGDLDVIMTYGLVTPDSDNSHQVAWYENVGKGGKGTEWKKHIVVPKFPSGVEVVAGDLDGDGDLDLVATGWTPNGRIVWIENTGDPKTGWKMHTLRERWANAITVVVADFDKDGRLDIAACAERGANEVRLWRNLGPALIKRR